MEKPFTNPLALEWLVKADADFVTANRELRARKMPNYDAACFHAQQCVEKLLKSIMIHEDLVPPKSHDLSYLLNLTLPQRPMWEVFRKGFQLLSAYAVEYIAIRVNRQQKSWRARPYGVVSNSVNNLIVKLGDLN